MIPSITMNSLPLILTSHKTYKKHTVFTANISIKTKRNKLLLLNLSKNFHCRQQGASETGFPSRMRLGAGIVRRVLPRQPAAHGVQLPRIAPQLRRVRCQAELSLLELGRDARCRNSGVAAAVVVLSQVEQKK